MKKISEWKEFSYLELIFLECLCVVLINIGMMILAHISEKSIFYIAKEILLILGAIGVILISISFGLVMLIFYNRYVDIQRENEERKKKIEEFEKEFERLKGK